MRERGKGRVALNLPLPLFLIFLSVILPILLSNILENTIPFIDVVTTVSPSSTFTATFVL